MRRFGLILLFSATLTTAFALSFDPTARYSQVVIDACLGNFSGNTTETGFNTFDANGTLVEEATHNKSSIDYVPGLVAKAVLEAVDYYQDQPFARPWFYSVEWYGNKFAASVSSSGGSLDDLNAVKLYFLLQTLASSGKFSAVKSETLANCQTALDHALQGLQNHNAHYQITTSSIPNATALPTPSGSTMNVTGGWWHKSNYNDQLWLDGLYMGPALLAQYLPLGQSITGTVSSDWDIILHQFDILQTFCWNATNQLYYHAFCADGGTNSSSRSTDWAGLSTVSGAECYHSASYWGRAEGWAVLAMVDVLEQMQRAGLDATDARFARLLAYLQTAATGLLRYQDPATGCWYQLLDKTASFTVTDYYADETRTDLVQSGTASNYLESSCTAIFTATLLKAIRLGFLPASTFEQPAKKAYAGLVEQFLRPNIDGNAYGLIGCCKSAGLGGNSGAKRRTGSAEYYLLGADTKTPTTSYTEGKVLGAFVLAAVEYERAYLPLLAPPTDSAPSTCRCFEVKVQ